MTTVHVEAVVSGRRSAAAAEHELQVSLASGPTSLRDLIEAIVRADVTAFIERADTGNVVRVLTDKALEDGLVTGAVRSGGREVAREVDPDEAVRTAIDAQRDGLFQTIVDDEPIEDLKGTIELREGTRVMFLRLVTLAGG